MNAALAVLALIACLSLVGSLALEVFQDGDDGKDD